MDLTVVLRDSGFSTAESKVYLTLLQIGQTKSGKLIKESGLQSSVVHNALNSLTEKGFVTHIRKGQIKVYNALHPNIVSTYLDEKRKQFENIIPQLCDLQKDGANQMSVEMYEGWKGLLTASLRLIEGGEKGDTYKYFAVTQAYMSEDLLDFFKKINNMQKRRGIKALGISNVASKKFLKNYKESKIKFVAQKIPPALSIFKDRVIIFSLSEKPTVIFIQSKEISAQYHDLWDAMYES